MIAKVRILDGKWNDGILEEWKVGSGEKGRRGE
jgi:hypothetical protein